MDVSRIKRLVAAIVTLVLVGPIGVAVAAQTPVAESELRVMTYNTHHSAGNDDCEDPETAEGEIPEAECALDVQRIADVIAAQAPDIVGLQEVDRFWARSGSADQAEELAGLLGMDVCFGANLDHGADEHAEEPHQYGVAILSAYPIESCENTFLPTTEGWEQRGLLDARVQIPGLGEVAILNTHFQSNASGEETEAGRQRTDQADAVAEYVANAGVPVILMGDFNAEPGDEELTSLVSGESGLADAWVMAGDGGEGLTRPAAPDEEPDERIDLIFVSAEFTVTHAEVIDDEETRMASDHFPVIADLVIGGGSTPMASPVVS